MHAVAQIFSSDSYKTDILQASDPAHRSANTDFSADSAQSFEEYLQASLSRQAGTKTEAAQENRQTSYNEAQKVQESEHTTESIASQNSHELNTQDSEEPPLKPQRESNNTEQGQETQGNSESDSAQVEESADLHLNANGSLRSKEHTRAHEEKQESASKLHSEQAELSAQRLHNSRNTDSQANSELEAKKKNNDTKLSEVRETRERRQADPSEVLQEDSPQKARHAQSKNKSALFSAADSHAVSTTDPAQETLQTTRNSSQKRLQSRKARNEEGRSISSESQAQSAEAKHENAAAEAKKLSASASGQFEQRLSTHIPDSPNTSTLDFQVRPHAQFMQGTQFSAEHSDSLHNSQRMSAERFVEQFQSHFREQLSSDIIRHAQYIFRGGNSGEISMVLKPEELGRLRIRLQLENKSIAGKIFVENKHGMEAFTSVVEELRKAFMEQGFEDLQLDIAYEVQSNYEHSTAGVHENTQTKEDISRMLLQIDRQQLNVHEFDEVNIVV